MIEEVVQPVFESNGQQLSAQFNDLQVNENHLGKNFF